MFRLTNEIMTPKQDLLNGKNLTLWQCIDIFRVAKKHEDRRTVYNENKQTVEQKNM